MIHCEKGHENPDGAKFCKDCGTPLSERVNNNEISFKYTFRKLHPVANISFYVMLVAIPLFLTSLILTDYFSNKKYETRDYYKDKLSNLLKTVKNVDGFSETKIEEIQGTLYNRWEDVYNGFDYYGEEEEKFIKQISEQNFNSLRELRDRYFFYNDLLHNYFDIEYPGVIAILSLIGSIAGVLAFPFFFCAFNLRWKKFELLIPVSDAKKALKQHVFSINTTGESIRIKENPKGELMLYDKDNGRRAHYHLVQDENGKAELIGEKFNTQNLIRKVFGKEINFIEK